MREYQLTDRKSIASVTFTVPVDSLMDGDKVLCYMRVRSARRWVQKDGQSMVYLDLYEIKPDRLHEGAPTSYEAVLGDAIGDIISGDYSKTRRYPKE